ncbi:MAG TPA: ATP-grasp family protein [Dehalococcoidia bacterium]|nr:ATP-grasp family protein [Dehalococcoidia bacterium]
MTYRIGVAGLADGRSSLGLVRAFHRRGHEAFVFEAEEVTIDLERSVVAAQDRRLDELDAVVVKKLGDNTDPRVPLRVNMLHALQSYGVRVFSDPSAIAHVNDRYRMTTTLALAGVPIPPTVVTDALEEAADTIERWGAAVLKPVYTSKARGMHLLRAQQPYRLVLRDWEAERTGPYYIQRFVPHAGRDLGIAVLGGRALGAYYRVGRPGDWRTSVQRGGHYERADPAPDIVALAERVASIFGLDFTVVDVVETDAGPLVYEASAFGGFGGLAAACNIDAADAYAEHVVRELKRG